MGLYTQNADESYQLVEKKDINITAGDNGSKSVTFEGLDSSKTYYVFELDKDGDTIVPDGGMTEVGKKTFVASYSNGNMVTMDAGIPGDKTITEGTENHSGGTTLFNSPKLSSHSFR